MIYRTVGICDSGMIKYDVVADQNPLPCTYCDSRTHWFIIFPKTKNYLPSLERERRPVCINCVYQLKEDTFRGKVEGAGMIKFYAHGESE